MYLKNQFNQCKIMKNRNLKFQLNHKNHRNHRNQRNNNNKLLRKKNLLLKKSKNKKFSSNKNKHKKTFKNQHLIQKTSFQLYKKFNKKKPLLIQANK